MKQEKEVSAVSGYIMIVVALVIVSLEIVAAVIIKNPLLFILGVVTLIFFIRGFFMVNPNESRVPILFGDYAGTVKSRRTVFSGPILFTIARRSL